MILESVIARSDLVVPVFAALALFCGVLVLGWPYLVPDPLTQRMKQVLNTRGREQRRDRSQAIEGQKRRLLRSEPSKMLAAIVKRFNLSRQLKDGVTVQLLRTAGFRGRSPVITYLAMRVLMPVCVMGFVAGYIFLIIKPDVHVMVILAILMVAGYLGYYVPLIYVKNRIAKRQQSIRRSWPDALDLLLICVESGMSSEHAFRKVADEIGDQSKELAEELSLTTAELSFLPDRRTAYENLGRRTDLDEVKAVVSGLMQSEKYGTSLGHALRVLAEENRAMRMSEADKKAAALPPKLTVPMVIFFLPVLFAVVITPAVIQIINN